MINNFDIRSKESTKQKCLIASILFLISLSVHFFCNIFSPIMLSQLEPDQMMFYMAGKAWMHGMVPYVDFIDVKGPLLWLFYGIGYLITPDKTGGVYLLLVLSTTLTLWYIYNLSRTLNLTSEAAILACTLTLFALFNYDTKGGRAEDIMQPFIACLLYYFTKYLQHRNSPTKQLKPIAYATGVCIAAAFLIKFNMMIFGLSVALLIFISEWKERQFKPYFIHFLPRLVAGALMLLAPFFIILAYYGSLDDFFQAYLFINSQSSGYLFPPTSSIICNFTFRLVQWTKGIYILTGAAFFIPHLFPGKQTDTYERMCLFLIFIIGFTINNALFNTYYLIVLTPFFAYLAIAIIKRMRPIGLTKTLLVIPCILLAVISHNGTWLSRCPRTIRQHATADLQALEKELQSKPNPKIIYFHYLDYGFGMNAGALPGCPYWTKLNGLRNHCDANQREAIRKKKADYIVTTYWNGEKGTTPSDVEFLKMNGYHLHGHYIVNSLKSFHAELYKKQER